MSADAATRRRDAAGRPRTARAGTVVLVVAAVAALAAGFSLLGLLLDRRSLVASTLLYLSAILTYATFRSGLGLSTAAAVVPLTIGILVILLGVGWDHARAALLRVVPFRRAFRAASFDR